LWTDAVSEAGTELRPEDAGHLWKATSDWPARFSVSECALLPAKSSRDVTTDMRLTTPSRMIALSMAALDAAVVSELLARHRYDNMVEHVTPREPDGGGLLHQAIADRLVVSVAP